MSQSAGVAERLHGLDALRGGLLLLGVILHATGPFVPLDEYWAVRDINQVAEIGWLSYLIHVFRMTAFFVIAGLFARMSIHRLGTSGFARDRLRRILLPLVVGWVAIIPATIAIARETWAHSYGAVEMHNGFASPATITPDNIPLQHLWFLYILSLLCALVVVAKWAMSKLDPQSRLSSAAHKLARPALSTPFVVVIAAAPATIALGTMHGWTASIGIPTPSTGLFYIARPLLVYGAAFAVGWLMHRNLDIVRGWTRWWPWILAVAFALSFACLRLSIEYPPGSPAPDAMNSLGQAALYSLAGWTFTFLLIALALRFMSRPSATRRYLADSSYWIYLVHPPLLLWLGDAVRNVDWPGWLKLLLTVSVSMAILLASYQVLVRHTFIGAVLNGRRLSQTPPQPAIS